MAHGESKFWDFSLANLVTWVMLMGGCVFAVSAFATKSSTDTANDKVIASDLKARLDNVDVKQRITEGRIVAIETAIPYIQKSLDRIEQAVTPKK